MPPDTPDRPVAPAPVTRSEAPSAPATPEAVPTPRPDLPPAAQRALAEAEARRKAAKPLDLPPEFNGRDGPEPIRYGDYELKGRAVDF